MNKPIVVLGASGQVGLFVTARLLEAGHQVIAVRREAPKGKDPGIDGLESIGWHDLNHRIEQGRQGAGRDYSLLSCGPVRLAQELLSTDGSGSFTSWERVVVTGTTSIQTKENSADVKERSTIREITQACDAIRGHCRQRDLPLAILSPTLIYGCGLDENLSRVFRWIQRFSFAPIAQKASGLRQPLHVEDLAQTLFAAVTLQSAPIIDSAVCGAGTIPYDEMIAGLFKAAKKKKKLIRLPDLFLPFAIAASRLVSISGNLNREMFRRQSQNLVFDDSLAREGLGHDPRAYDPVPQDFCLPDSIKAIRNALL